MSVLERNHWEHDVQNNTILEVKTAKLHLFLQGGFFDSNASTFAMHAHGYTELHLVVDGKIRFFVGQRMYTLNVGDVLVIPQNVYHACVEKESGTRTVAFQIEKMAESVKTEHISPELAAAFAKEIEAAKQKNDFKTVVKYVSLVCDPIFEEERIPAVASADYALIINEFFSNRYHQKITLVTLARELNLSEKQAARLVRKHTGRTFQQELTRRRIGAANYLVQSTKLTMREIAEHVGFKSYSGFWKAYRKLAAKDPQQEATG